MICAGHLLGFTPGRLARWAVRLRAGVWLAVCVLGTGAAEGATNQFTPYAVRTWQADDGLPQNSVYCIAQTRDGYLWVGTREGLARFDGVRFTPPDERAPEELQRGWVTALCASKDGSLWIGCDGYGLARWKEGKFTRFSEADGLASNQIRCLLEAADGTLWIGSEGGVTRFKDGKFKSYAERNNLAANSVKGLCVDPQGNLRIATRRGLSRLDKEGSIRTFNIRPGTPANSLMFVCTDSQGRIWTGSNEGLNCVAGETIVTYGVAEGLPEKIVFTAHEDRSGQLWVGTSQGLARLIGDRFVPWQAGGGAFVDQVYTIFEDRERNIWVGGQDGLHRLVPAHFTAYTTRELLTRNNAMSVCEDNSGTMWVGSWDGGLNRLKDEKIIPSGMGGALRNGQVLGLCAARDGGLWVGLDHGGGLLRVKGGSQSLFARAPALFDAAVRVIHEDRTGVLWVGTSRGLNVLKAGKSEAYTAANGLAGDMVMALREDPSGGMWIGTDRGLSRCADGKLSRGPLSGPPITNWVNAIYLDTDQTLWVGTRGGGLFRCAGDKVTVCTTRQGLFSDEIYEIVEDDFGYFWMSCRKGIFRVSKKQLEDLAQGARQSIGCTAFGRADGLPSIQCNGVAKPAGWKDRDGRLWFPTIRGVVAVQPAVKTNQRPPPVFIEEVVADGRSLQTNAWTAGDALRLSVPPGRGSLEIHFTALSFEAPEKNRFKYRLKGADPDWVDAGTRRVASYDNLAPGNYSFQVIACNNDGVWNDEGATLALTLVPHYWQTWWFKVALGGGLGLLLALLYRLRVTRLRAIERLRVQIAANLHDDVGARLTKVGMLTELVDRETVEQNPNKPHVRNISRTVREITRAMDEIVWTINPKNDSLDHLANYIFQYAQDYFQDTGISCRLDMPAQLPDRPVSTEVRHNLFMAVKEALNNTLKHAAASEVRIGLGVQNGHMTITVSDNGRGFAVGPARGKGNGLENMDQRLRQIGGHLVLQSEPGRGTSIRMEAAGV
jgi:ligand-binding sensor domain-containing protein/two-component sensor histidine kinase